MLENASPAICSLSTCTKHSVLGAPGRLLWLIIARGQRSARDKAAQAHRNDGRLRSAHHHHIAVPCAQHAPAGMPVIHMPSSTCSARSRRTHHRHTCRPQPRRARKHAQLVPIFVPVVPYSLPDWYASIYHVYIHATCQHHSTSQPILQGLSARTL